MFFTNAKSKFSPDANFYFKDLKEISEVSINDFKEAKDYRFDNRTVIIDAIFGTGLSRTIDGELKDLINFLNLKKNIKISIDIPSGVYADTLSDENSIQFEADYTLSFQFWKKSFLHPETGKYASKVEVLDINLSEEFIDETESKDFIIDKKLIENIFRPRKEFSHKGTFGKAVIVAGSYGKIGAAVLSTKSALHTGAGLTFTAAPQCGYQILQTVCPEAMFIQSGDNFIENIENDENYTYGIGPGLGSDKKTVDALLNFLKSYSKPLVLDADALNIISLNEKYQKLIPKKSIITPHPKEFERLFGESKNSFERVDLAKKKAQELDIFIVLKDHHTQIITPDGNVFYNITGNSGLAKGGSGDVLTGILTSFLAQQYSEIDSAILAVWFHGKAAEIAAENYSKEAMLPTDIINSFGTVFLELNNLHAKNL